MSIRSCLVCVLVITSLASTLDAQTKTVTLDLNSGLFSAGVPFDQRFTLMVTSADKLAQSITLVYGKLDKADCEKQQARGICASAPALRDSKTKVWKRGDVGPGFIIDALTHNTCYGFHITQHLQPLSEDDRKKVRELLSKEFRARLIKAFNDGTLSESELLKIQNDLQKTAEETVAAQFLSCIPPPPVINLKTEAAVKARTTVLETSATAIEDKERNIPARRADVLNALCLDNVCDPRTKDWAKSLSNDLASLLADPSVLAPGASLAWSAPLNPAREAHKTTTMAQVARALATSTPNTLADLINSSLKLSGPNLEKAAEADPQTIALLADFFDVYLSDTFRRKKNATTEPVVDQTLADQIRAAMPLRRLANALMGQVTAKQTLDTTLLPDVLADQVLSRGFNLTTSPTVITEGKNPYIGVDAGMGYAFNLDKPYVYVGANFYTVPINKDEKDVPYFRSRGLAKRGSVLLGLATAVDGTKNLVGPGTPMVGVGYRFHRYGKLSGGWIAFKQKDENPLIDKDSVKVEPFMSLSIDTDLKALLGGVGKLFGF